MLRRFRVHSCPAVLCLLAIVVAVASGARAQTPPPGEYRVLATLRTSTMEKELNEASGDGFRFQEVMGGETAFGGHEVVVIMSRAGEAKPHYAYKLLATSKTSTMEKELQQAADEGFVYRGQTVFDSEFGGRQVVCILERDEDAAPQSFEYKLLATSRTSTMQKEVSAAAASGFQVLGLTVGKTAFGGDEVVVITRRARTP